MIHVRLIIATHPWKCKINILFTFSVAHVRNLWVKNWACPIGVFLLLCLEGVVLAKLGIRNRWKVVKFSTKWWYHIFPRICFSCKNLWFYLLSDNRKFWAFISKAVEPNQIMHRVFVKARKISYKMVVLYFCFGLVLLRGWLLNLGLIDGVAIRTFFAFISEIFRLSQIIHRTFVKAYKISYKMVASCFSFGLILLRGWLLNLRLIDGVAIRAFFVFISEINRLSQIIHWTFIKTHKISYKIVVLYFGFGQILLRGWLLNLGLIDGVAIRTFFVFISEIDRLSQIIH